MAAGIERGQHATGNTVQIAIELALHATQTIVIGAHVSQHLGGELAVGIKALEFLLEIDAFEVQRLYPRDLGRFQLARNPCEVSRGVQPGCNLMRSRESVGGVGVHDFGQCVEPPGASLPVGSCRSAISEGTA